MSSDWVERALLKTSFNKETGCWEYAGEIVHNGYGRIWFEGQNVRIHRLSYLRFKGEICSGLLVCHKCDVRNCWNPDHLFLGTYQDNVDDMIAKGRQSATKPQPKRGESAYNAKLTAAKVEEIRALRASRGFGRRRIAKMFSVSPSVIDRVIKRKAWTHV